MEADKPNSIQTLIKIHEEKDAIDFKKIWAEGLFVFDANVLLDLYRLPISAQQDLIDLLKNKKLNDRIWVSFQILLEFLSNRYEAIGDQKAKFFEVKDILEKSKNQYNEIFSNLQISLNKLKLKQRHSLIDPEKFINEEKISSGIKFVDEFIEELATLENKQFDVVDKDNIKKTVLELFEGKTGESLQKEKLEELYKEGEKRYKDEVPPGYLDTKKTGSYTVGNIQYERKYGDLVLWREIIEKANSDRLKYVILVTGDLKEDWWLQKRGKNLGPRKELLNEIYRDAPSVETFYMYDTSRFLEHAKKEFNTQIKDSSIAETKELIERNRQSSIDAKENTDILNLHVAILSVTNKFKTTNFTIANEISNLPPIAINADKFINSIYEIIEFVLSVSEKDVIEVIYANHESAVSIVFRAEFNGNDAKRFETKNISSAAYLRLREVSRTEKIKKIIQDENISISLTRMFGFINGRIDIPVEKFISKSLFSYKQIL